ncbi:MAG: hypothetical protein ACAH04_08845 [Methylibium sp.]
MRSQEILSLLEADGDHEGNGHFPSRRRDTGKQRRHLAIVGEADDQFVDEAGLADGARQ